MSLDFQMYGTEKLDDRDLSLSGDPMTDETAQEVLRSLGVFFYRANGAENGHGIILSPITETTNSFYYQGIMNDTEWEIDEWSDPTREMLKKHGDAKAWIIFAKQVVVIEVSESKIRVQSV